MSYVQLLLKIVQFLLFFYNRWHASKPKRAAAAKRAAEVAHAKVMQSIDTKERKLNANLQHIDILRDKANRINQG